MRPRYSTGIPATPSGPVARRRRSAKTICLIDHLQRNYTSSHFTRKRLGRTKLYSKYIYIYHVHIYTVGNG
uniref:Uncharacterized protein n=1 Tax=Zea mays TaxID=4577 RepID=B4FNI3_MAIZE|nr:unknown [Zea mays]